MTKKTKGIFIGTVAIAIAYLIGGCSGDGKSGSTSDGALHYRVVQIPTDVLPTCAVSAGQFNSWFASGTAAANGAVVPANSVAFPADASDSNFYKWAEQMFLWVTSRKPDNSIVLENSEFYMVLPDSVDGHRQLIPCQPGNFRTVGHINKFGAHGAFIQDRNGKMWKVLPADKEATVTSDKGVVKVARVEHMAGKHHLFDAKGMEIANPKAVMKGTQIRGSVAKLVTAGGKSVILSADGIVDADAETAQASGNALIAQNNSLVHYLLFVNDFYAYYATGQINGAFVGTRIDSLFPTDSNDQKLVCQYARQTFGVTIADSNALCMELKTAWVQVNGQLRDQANYITLQATVPHFNTVNDSMLVQDPTQVDSATLALIGMHILGSVNGHPEMIWSTFEHQSNAPNNAYVYTDTANAVVTYPADSCGGNWLLDDSTCLDENDNGMVANRSNGLDTINATNGFSPGPRNVRRQAPWGNFDASPGNANSVKQNTMVMSLNNSVRGQLNALGSDIRTNYMFVGALWTDGGVTPNPQSGFDTPTDTINARGGIQLANSTMETYMILNNIDAGCFDCHNSSLNPTLINDLSHIFGALNPLPIAPGAVKKK